MLYIKRNKLWIGILLGVFVVGFYIGCLWEKTSYERQMAEKIQGTVFGGMERIPKADHLQEGSKEKEEALELQKIMKKLDYITKQLDTLITLKKEENHVNNDILDPSGGGIENVSPSASSKPSEENHLSLKEGLNHDLQERSKEFDNFFKKNFPLGKERRGNQ